MTPWEVNLQSHSDTAHGDLLQHADVRKHTVPLAKMQGSFLGQKVHNFTISPVKLHALL